VASPGLSATSLYKCCLQALCTKVTFIKAEFILNIIPRGNLFDVIQGCGKEKVVKTWELKYNLLGFYLHKCSNHSFIPVLS